MTNTTQKIKEVKAAENVNPAAMSTAELEAYLEERKREEKSAQKQRERQYEKVKNGFVEASVKRFQELNRMLTDFKAETLLQGNNLHKQMYEIYQKEEKDLKSFSLTNESGTMKLELQRHERQGLDEHAEVAISEIKELLAEKFESRNKAMYAIIDDLLSTNAAGDYDPRLVSKLRKHEEAVNDPRFSQALDLLAKSYRPEGTSLYVRAYQRDDAKKPWKDVTLQFSAL